MLRPDNLCLCYGTPGAAGFRELVEAGAAGGFRSIGLAPFLYEAARAAGMTDRDMRSILEDHGMVVAELDPLLRWLPAELVGTDDQVLNSPWFSGAEDTFFRMAEAFGAHHINAVQLFGPRLDTEVYARHFARLCDRAAAHGLKVSLEFFPWASIRDLKVAAGIVEMAGRPNGGVLLDTWHHFRSGGSSQDILALRCSVVGLQMSDAAPQPWDDLSKEAMHHRLLPGEGVIDLVGTVRALDAIGCDAPLGLEVISREMRKLPPVEAARRAGAAARAVLEAAHT